MREQIQHSLQKLTQWYQLTLEMDSLVRSILLSLSKIVHVSAYWTYVVCFFSLQVSIRSSSLSSESSWPQLKHFFVSFEDKQCHIFHDNYSHSNSYSSLSLIPHTTTCAHTQFKVTNIQYSPVHTRVHVQAYLSLKHKSNHTYNVTNTHMHLCTYMHTTTGTHTHPHICTHTHTAYANIQ